MAWGGPSPEGGCGQGMACWGGRGMGRAQLRGLRAQHRGQWASGLQGPAGNTSPQPAWLSGDGSFRIQEGQPDAPTQEAALEWALGAQEDRAAQGQPPGTWESVSRGDFDTSRRGGGSTWPPARGSDTPHLTMSLMGSSRHWVGQQTGRKVLWGQEGVRGVLTPGQLEPVLGLGCGESGPLAASLSSPAQGCGAGDSLPPVLPLLALRFQPRRGLGLACAGSGVSQPHSFWLLRSPPRAGRRSPCVRDGNGYRAASWPGLLAASLVSATRTSWVVFRGHVAGSLGGRPCSRAPLGLPCWADRAPAQLLPGASRRVEAG